MLSTVFFLANLKFVSVLVKIKAIAEMDDRDDYMKKIFMFQFVMLLLQFNFDRLEVPHILFNCFDKLHQEIIIRDIPENSLLL